MKISLVKPESPGIPSFFNEYLNKKWFPKGIDLKDVGGIVTSLVKNLDPENPFVLREIYTFLGELHRLVIKNREFFQIIFISVFYLLKTRSY